MFTIFEVSWLTLINNIQIIGFDIWLDSKAEDHLNPAFEMLFLDV
jgi:hypothetical protein